MSTVPANRQPQQLPPRTQPPNSYNPWWIRLPVLFFIGGIVFVGALLALLVAFQSSYSGRIMPGVSAYNIDLGGMSPAEAQTVLDNHFDYDDSTVFTFRDGEDIWQFTAGDLGVSYDAGATVDQAMQVGRNDTAIGNLIDQALTYFDGETVTPIISYDERTAAAKLQEIASQIDSVGQHGALLVSGTEVIASPSIAGRTLDIDATLDALTAQIGTLSTGGEIPLVISETQANIVGIETAADRARSALSSPMTLVADDGNGNMLGPWTISPEQIAQLLDVTLNDNGDGTQFYTVDVDMSAFEGYLNSLAPGLITPPVNGRFHFNETTRQLEIIRPSTGGRELNVQGTLDALEAKVFNSDDRTVSMVYNYIPAPYHDGVTAEELGIRELISESTTYFNGSSPNRRINIAVSASRFDGVIIGPGEEFSFNSLLGEITEENGFVEGLVIFGGRTVAGLGGGVCQVSTTAFRAAFYGGYTIIERNSHGYRVGYYELNNTPPGLDAAIWTPERDFRFQNDTPYHLLIETEINPTQSTLQFRFYSTDTGRIVEVEEPRVDNRVPPEPTRFEANRDLQLGEIVQVDYAAEGADVNVTRTITYPDGNVRTDNIFTHYLPWGAIYQVAPGDSRLN